GASPGTVPPGSEGAGAVGRVSSPGVRLRPARRPLARGNRRAAGERRKGGGPVKGRILRAAVGAVFLAGAAAQLQPFTGPGTVLAPRWSPPGTWTPAGPPGVGADARMAGAPAPAQIVVMDIDGDLNSLTIANTTNFSSVGGLLGIGAGGLTRTAGNLTMDSSMVVVLTAPQAWPFAGGVNNIQANIPDAGLTPPKPGLGTLTFAGA